MGAWTLGQDAALQPAAPSPPKAMDIRAAQPATVEDPKGKVAEYAGRLLNWIPGEVLAIYAALLAAVSQSDIDTAVWITVACALATPVFVVGAAFYNSADQTWRSRRTLWRAGASLVAFAIWSITIPGSGWKKIEWFADNPEATALIVGGVAVLLNFFVSGVDKRIKD